MLFYFEMETNNSNAHNHIELTNNNFYLEKNKFSERFLH